VPGLTGLVAPNRIRRDRREVVFLFAQIIANVRYWHKADIASCTAHVCFEE